MPPDQPTVKDVVVIFVYDKLVGCDGAVVTELLSEGFEPAKFSAVTTTLYSVPPVKRLNVAVFDSTLLVEEFSFVPLSV